MIPFVIRWLQELNTELDAIEIAEILWLTSKINRNDDSFSLDEKSFNAVQSSDAELSSDTTLSSNAGLSSDAAPPLEMPSDLPAQSVSTSYFKKKRSEFSFSARTKRLPQTAFVRISEPPALRESLLLGKSMYPLKRKVPSLKSKVLDETATVNRIVDENLWVPVLKPLQEQWFDLTLVIEQVPTLPIWNQVIIEWERLVKYHGAFRNVRIWTLAEQQANREWLLFPGRNSSTAVGRSLSPQTVVEPDRRNLIVILSDCTSASWQDGRIFSLIEEWAVVNSVSILHLMPENYWGQTVLSRGRFVQLASVSPAPINKQFLVDKIPEWEEPVTLEKSLKIPVIAFEPASLKRWAQVITASGTTKTVGIVFESAQIMSQSRQIEIAEDRDALTRIQQFCAVASQPARKLAGLIAAIPVTNLQLVKLIQQTMLPSSSPVHLAEVFLGGLMQIHDAKMHGVEIAQEFYDFYPGVRDGLLQTVPVSETSEVLEKVSTYIAKQVGYSISSFDALLDLRHEADIEIYEQIKEFAQVTPQVLRRLGGSYVQVANEIEESWLQDSPMRTSAEVRRRIHNALDTGAVSLDLSGLGIQFVPPELGQLFNLTELDLSQNQLTSWPPELSQLFNLTRLDLSSNQLSTVPIELGQLSNLTWLALSQNQLVTLPPELGQLSNLTWLALSQNQLMTMPPELSQLSDLTELDLSQNQLTSVPPELGQLSNLTRLALSQNQLVTMPPELSQLFNLTELGLSQNQLTSWPPELSQLFNLTELALSFNQLSTVPPELGQLSNLTELDLSFNQLSTVPPELGQLSNLTRLDLSQNQLVTVPLELSQLFNLTELALSSNQLSTVPPELGQLSNLTRLDLSQNQLVTVPPELSQLFNLTELALSSNQLSTVPPELGQLSNLTELALSQNQLVTVPSELSQLSNLTELALSSNQLSTVPPELIQLSNLAELDLSQNQLTSVPPELGQLSNLTRLALSQNQLVTVPPELSQLSNLTELDLSQNQLVTVPSELSQLSNLTELALSSNQLSTVPPELSQLSNLTELDLSQNQLTSWPPELSQLFNLTRLDLSFNQLSTLPPELGQLSNLTELDLSSNQLTSPPPEVVEQGLQSILAYLKDQQDNGEQQWLSKLLIVGEGGVGKTSLLRSLQGLPFSAQQSSTHGIELNPLPLAHPTEPDVTMTLNTWDFGGQEIYHATHQFFLTNRSLFLLAFNARLGFEQGKLIYWLKTIRANAPESPVILVATYTDERDADLPLTELKKQFPQILDLYEISNKTEQGIPELKQAITTAAANLPSMGELWPTTWFKFANAIRKSKKKKTTPQEFYENMEKFGVSEDGKPVLANWLHELGDILFFQDDDDVNDLVILKPQWVTEYISKVLAAEEVIARNGIFTRQCMNKIWKDLPTGLRGFFLRLMERFDLSYRTLDNHDISLVVERLSFEPPDYHILWEAKQQEPDCKKVSMRYQLDEILPGIPTWFIARQHRFTIKQGDSYGIHWRTGVLFQDYSRKHLGLVRTQRDESNNTDYLNITVCGPVPHNFFDVLRKGLELTLVRYPGLRITRLLPCPDPEQTDCTHAFDYASLTRRLELKRPKILVECPNCFSDISVPRMLFGLHDTTQDAVIEKIDALQGSTTQVFNELRTLVQRNVIQEIRVVQKQLESPCPTIFTLRPTNKSQYRLDNLTSNQLYLQLYCEYPGDFHPVQSGGLYLIDNPREWVTLTAPYLKRLFSILKYVTPVVGSSIGVANADYAELIKNDLAFTQSIVSQLPDIEVDERDARFITPSGHAFNRPNPVSGSALRALHEFLKRKDPDQTWGNLRRTVTPEGDVLWLCKEHYKEVYPTSALT